MTVVFYIQSTHCKIIYSLSKEKKWQLPIPSQIVGKTNHVIKWPIKHEFLKGIK